MSTYLYQYPDTQEVQSNSAFVAQLANTDNVYLLPHEIADGTLVGEWDNDGQLVFMDDAVYKELRPFGNDAGMATDDLDLIHYQGHAQRHMQEIPLVDTLPQYFDDEQPFVIRMERYERTDEWAGWSWKATIEFVDLNREPINRAIGIYPGGDWDAAGWTTGAFVWTEVGTDEEGQPIMKWQTECPPGRETATKEPLYYALLHGSAHEGRMVLLEEMDSLDRLFWEYDQPPSGGTKWVPIIAVTNGMAGTVVLITPDNTEVVVGDKLRIAGVEVEVATLWNTGGITTTPYQAFDTGLIIEKWQ